MDFPLDEHNKVFFIFFVTFTLYKSERGLDFEICWKNGHPFINVK